jgi:hypothetical protein
MSTNTIKDFEYGLYLVESSHNLIFHNELNDNVVQGIDIDSEYGNYWYHPELLEGNYWSDYLGLDEDGDLIGDTDTPWPQAGFDEYPLLIDSDGDGVADNNELAWGTDPNNPSDTYTPGGEDVEITDPNTGISLEFDNIEEPGATTVEVHDSGPAAPAGFSIYGTEPIWIEIDTTASFLGTIEIGIPYDAPPWQEPALRLLHFNEYTHRWEDITTRIDTVNKIIYGELTSFSTFAVMEVTDLMPPETTINLSTHYNDAGIIYVTSATEFSLMPTDDCSGVTHTFYSINGGAWIEYVASFTISGTDGSYTIEYYSTDFAGNEEDIQSLTVILVSISLDSTMTDDVTPFDNFDIIFRNGNDGYTLITTNPGQFHYYIELVNNWPITLDSLILNIAIPPDFETQGTNPIHIYLDGVEVTDLCLIEGTTVTIYNVPAGGQLLVTVHLDYALKGQVYQSLDDFQLRQYVYVESIAAIAGELTTSGEGLEGEYDSATTIFAKQKKTTAIAGFVRDSTGNPLVGVTVELIDPVSGEVKGTALTDDDGLYYFIDMAVGEYLVRATVDGQQFTQTAVVVKDELTQIDFDII